MGFKIPPPPTPAPVPAGNACVNCWGTGKPFGDGDTPNQIVISISGILQGPNWIPADGVAPEGEFVLAQTGGVPCNFLLSPDISTRYGVEFNVANTTITLERDFLDNFFLGIGTPCDTFVENTLNDHWTDGSIKITIPEVLL